MLTFAAWDQNRSSEEAYQNLLGSRLTAEPIATNQDSSLVHNAPWNAVDKETVTALEKGYSQWEKETGDVRLQKLLRKG